MASVPASLSGWLIDVSPACPGLLILRSRWKWMSNTDRRQSGQCQKKGKKKEEKKDLESFADFTSYILQHRDHLQGKTWTLFYATDKYSCRLLWAFFFFFFSSLWAVFVIISNILLSRLTFTSKWSVQTELSASSSSACLSRNPRPKLSCPACL